MDIKLSVIPVAGHGTRLLPLTKTLPKEMLPVGRRPVVQHIVEELVANGLERILFITGRGKTSIEDHFHLDAELTAMLRETGKEDLLAELAFERHRVEYFYTRQRRQLGLGHAISCARSFVGREPFVVALGDAIIGLRSKSTIVGRMCEEFVRRDAQAVICFEEVARAEVSRYGIARPRGEPTEVFELDDLVEKPAPAEAPSNLAVAARYVLSPEIFDFLARTTPGKGGEIQLTDALRAMGRAGGRLVGVRLPPTERRYDIGNFTTYYRAFVDHALSDPDDGPALRSHLERLLRADESDGTD